jgi:hypothetical protein
VVKHKKEPVQIFEICLYMFNRQHTGNTVVIQFPLYLLQNEGVDSIHPTHLYQLVSEQVKNEYLTYSNESEIKTRVKTSGGQFPV